MQLLSTAQVAELKGCSLQYVQKCIKEGKIKATMKENAANNRTEYAIAISDLPEKLQRKWEEQQRRELGLEPDFKTDLKPNKNKHVPYQITLADLSYEQRDEVAFWSNLLQEWLVTRDQNAKRFGKCKVDEMFIAAQKLKYPELSISPDILYRKYRAYKEHNLEGLIDHRGGSNKGQTRIPRHIWDYFKWLYLTENRNTVSQCYRDTVTWAKEFYPEDVSGIPCERTFRRQIQQIPFAPYGGKEKRFKGLSRQEAWNEGIKETEFVDIAEKSLDLLLKRVSRPQKIRENGVFVTICGEQLWYMADDTYMYIGEEVYVRYDPADPRSVRVYDMETDKYRWTWQLADDLMMNYIENNLDMFADPNRRISAVKKALNAMKRGVIEAVDLDKRIDAFALMVKNGADEIERSGGIQKPPVLSPVFSEEEIEKTPQLKDITHITSIVALMTATAQAARKDG